MTLTKANIDDLLSTSRVEATLEHLRKLIEAGDRLALGSPYRNTIEDIIAEARQIIAEAQRIIT